MPGFNRPLGAFKDRRDPRDFRYRLAGEAIEAAKVGDYPNTIDNREYFGPVTSQGSEPSCVGHAVAGIAEMMLSKALGKQMDFSPRAAYEWARLHDAFPGEDYDGSTMRGGLKAWYKMGMAPWDAWPYIENDICGVAPDVEKQASKYKLPQYERLLGLSEARFAVYQQGAALMTAMVTSAWNNPGQAIILSNAIDKEEGLHATVLAGYDDPKRYFWVRNSWGLDWGDEGYGKLSYEDFTRYATDLWLPIVPIEWLKRAWLSFLSRWPFR